VTNQKRITETQLDRFKPLLNRFGSEDLEDRLYLLENTFLACRANPDAVFYALRSASNRYWIEKGSGKLLDRSREARETLLSLRKHLPKQLKAMRSLATDFGAFNPEIVSTIDKLLKALKPPSAGEFDYPKRSILYDAYVAAKVNPNTTVQLDSKMPSHTIPLRRSSRGKPARQWIKGAHAKLRAAGVTALEHRNDLFVAIGLFPYRRD